MKKAYLLLFLMSASAIEAAPGDFQKGISFYKQGQYDKAIREFEQIVKADPDYEDGHRILGDCYLKMKRYDRAIAAFENALKLKSDSFPSHYKLALAYYNSGQYRVTISTLLKAERYARSPSEQYRVYKMRGPAYFNNEEFDKAISDLRKAISIRRGDQTDVLQLGIAYYHVGNYAEAEKYLKQTLTLNPDSSEAKRYLSQVKYRQGVGAIAAGSYKTAVAILNNYIDTNRQDGEAWFNLALAHLFLDDLKASEEAFLNAAKSMPTHGAIHDRLGFIYEKREDYHKALQAYRKAYELTRDAQVKESVDRVQERIRRRKKTG